MLKTWVHWTVEEEAILKEFWPICSATVIAERVNKTRNSVIGKAHRMRLPSKGLVGIEGKKKDSRQKLTKATDPTPPPPPKRIQEKSPPAYVPPTQIWSGKGVPLLEAVNGQCRAVMGSSADSRGLAIYCGEPVSHSHFSFCPYHLALYTYPAKWGR